MFYVYVLQNLLNQDDYYTGYTCNLKRRLSEHNAGANTSTRNRKWRIVYYEAYISELVARDRERKLKQDGRVKRFLMQRVKSQI